MGIVGAIMQTEEAGKLITTLYMNLTLDEVVETRSWKAFRPDRLDVYSLDDVELTHESRLPEDRCDLRPSLKYTFAKLADYPGNDVRLELTDEHTLSIAVYECNRVARIQKPDCLLDDLAQKMSLWVRETPW